MLRTRSPVYSPLRAFSLDLHVLGTPPAFVLSQDQTLQLRIRFPSAFPRSAPGYRGARDSALKALRCPQYLRGLAIQFSETDEPFRLRTSDCDAPPPCFEPSKGERYLPPSTNRVKSRDPPPLERPRRVQGPRCLAEPFRPVKNTSRSPLNRPESGRIRRNLTSATVASTKLPRHVAAHPLAFGLVATT